MTRNARLRALLGAALVAASGPASGEWPQHLGPTGLGVSPAKGVFAKGLAPKVAWRASLQTGDGAVAIAGDRLFAIAVDDDADYAVALDLTGGKELWRVKLDALPPNSANVAGLVTPAVSGGKVVTVSTHCQLRAHDAATGAVSWHRDLKADFTVPAPRACTGSPLVEGGLALVTLPGKDDAGFGAFDLTTGKTAWVAAGKLRSHFGQSSLATLGGERVVLVNHAVLPPPPAEGQRPGRPRGGVTALRVADGAVVLSHTLEEGFGWAAPLLLAADRLAYFTFNELRLFQLSREGDGWRVAPAWSTTAVAEGHNPPFVQDGVLYGVRDDDLTALDFATGAVLWKHKMYFGAAYALDGHVALVPRTAGLLQLGKATRTGFEEKGRLEVLARGPALGGSPVYASGLLLLKNDEELVAVRLN